MSPADDVREMLEAESLGLTFQTNLFVGREPSQPDNCVSIFDIPSYMPPELTLENDADLHYPSIQIRVRNKSYITGYDLIFDIMKTLHGRGPETWNGMVYSAIICVGDPMLLDWEQNRCRWVCSFNLIRREA
jgi:hypothetical protein